jgi:hypothetical protein
MLAAILDKNVTTRNIGLPVNKQEGENCNLSGAITIFNVIGNSLSNTHNYSYG